MVLLALGALAWLVYYLYKKHLTLSERAQAIRDSFKHCPPQLQPHDLDKAARIVEALENEAENIKSTLHITADKTVRFQIKLSSFFDLLSAQKKKLIIEIRSDRTYRVQCITGKLGRGSYGKVVELFDLHTNQQTAMKIATPAKQNKNNEQDWKQAETDLTKEYNNFAIVYNRGAIHAVGVQHKPLSKVIILIKLTANRLTQRLAYEGNRYNGSLDQLVLQKISFKMRLYITLQVLQGMETLRAKKLIHHDLKLQNILYRFRPQERMPQVFVSDLGGATHENDLPEELKSGLTHTPAFTNSSRIALASWVPIDSVQKYFTEGAVRCSIGLTLCSILTGYCVTKDDYDTFRQLTWFLTNPPNQLKKYERLFSTLHSYIQNGLISGYFNMDLSDLREMVQKFYDECPD
jgi:serine/threonine protein kinase